MILRRTLLTAIATMSIAVGCLGVPEQTNRPPADASGAGNGNGNGNGNGGGNGNGNGNGTGGGLDDDDETPPGGDGTERPPQQTDPLAAVRNQFVTTVEPIMLAKCGDIAACHGGGGNNTIKFIPADKSTFYEVATSYDRLVGNFDKVSAPILTKVLPGHQAVTYETSEIRTIETWLDAELEARSTPGGTPPPASGLTPGTVSKELVQKWSGCMDLADWQAENVAVLFANLGSGEGPCIRCHVNGQGQYIATDDTARMFKVVSENKYFMQSYFSPNVVDLAAAKMEVNRGAFERVATGLPPHIEHPRFNVDSTAMQALVRFYDKTMARMTAGTCNPPRITD